MTVRLRAVLENHDAKEALVKAAELLEQIAEDYPWNQDIQDATRDVRFAANSLRTIEVDDHTDG